MLKESITEFSTASIGSGSLGHSLILPMRYLLSVAENSSKGLHMGNFSQHVLLEEPQQGGSDSTTTSRSSRGSVQLTKKQAKTSRQEPKDRLTDKIIHTEASLFKIQKQNINRNNKNS